MRQTSTVKNRSLMISCLAAAIVAAIGAGCATRDDDRTGQTPAGQETGRANGELAANQPAETAPQASLDDQRVDAAEVDIATDATAAVASKAIEQDAVGMRRQALAREEAKLDEATRSETAMQVAIPYAPPPPPAPMIANNVAPVLGYAGATTPADAEVNTENYTEFDDGGIVRADEQPVSTFSIDVDTGSYSNVRRMLAQGQLPPKDAVRVEEMVNYFDYDYAAPASRKEPFRVATELAPAPWDSKRVLMHIGIQGYDVAPEEIPAANLVFLIDTSGSMADADKLPLLKESFRQLVPHLRAQDRVSIVVYAGSAGLVLAPTPGDHHDEILAALDRLEAGGSTNGGEGIELAYATAQQAFIERGVNRIVLATDGDFNVGIYEQNALETRVAQGRETGIALTTLGFGQGNYNEAMAEQLADVGDGNHAYIDNLMEGRKVLVEEMTSTILTIASDVKIQVEFDPAVVAEYRLIGYENRALAREDFNNDQIDAGEIGAGHDVTAIYELCLVGAGCDASDPLRYGSKPAPRSRGDELAFLKLRYKLPGSDRSVLMQRPVARGDIHATASENLRFAAAVAAYADLLRGGGHVGTFGWDEVESLARGARGTDAWGYRAEFLQLLSTARSLSAPRDPDPVAITLE